MSEFKLFQEIIALSETNTWDEAVSEWKLDYIIQLGKHEKPKRCLCNHYPIKELCFLRNTINGRKALVGNCCVNKFMGIETNKLFNTIGRVVKDNSKSFNDAFINFAYDKYFIDDWEREFYIDIWRKRKLTTKQKHKKLEINKKLLAALEKEKNTKKITLEWD